jgi:hypothetical protein
MQEPTCKMEFVRPAAVLVMQILTHIYARVHAQQEGSETLPLTPVWRLVLLATSRIVQAYVRMIVRPKELMLFLVLVPISVLMGCGGITMSVLMSVLMIIMGMKVQGIALMFLIVRQLLFMVMM